MFPRATAEGVWWAQIATADGKMAYAFSSNPRDNASWKIVPLDIPAGEASATVTGDEVIVIVGSKLYVVTQTGFEVMSDNPNMPVPRGEPIMLPGGRLMIAAGESQWFFTEDMGRTWTTAASGLGNIGWLYATEDGYAAIDYLRAGWALVSRDGLVWNKLPIR